MLWRMVREMLFAGEELLRLVRYVSPFDVFASDGHWNPGVVCVVGVWVLFAFCCAWLFLFVWCFWFVCCSWDG